MREDNLLCVRKRKFVVTTDSNHGKKTCPNLARKMILTDVDQLWVADITTGSSKEIVGRLGFWQFAQVSDKGRVRGAEGSESVGSSHSDFGFVV
jgi:hypothetical protein